MSIKSMHSFVSAIVLFSSIVLAALPATIAADTEPPWITSYYPIDGAYSIPIAAVIYVNFSEPMNQMTVSVDTQPFIALFPAWAMQSNLALTHTADFLACTYYTVNVTGEDLAGNPLDGNHDGIGGDPFVWRFATDCGAPYIVSTIPADGETDVPLTQEIFVTFSDRMNLITFSISISPVLAFSAVWMNDDTIIMLTHGAPFQPCTIYTVTVFSPDLVPGPSPPVPNPWHFTTTGCKPVITGIYPPQVDAPIDATIRVDFSTTMNNATVSWSLNRTLVLTPSWGSGNRTLSLAHVEKFHPCTSYSFTITGKDMLGQILDNGSFPMPYNFTTICTYPTVLQTSPYRTEANVPLDAPIVITFSESMDTKSVEDSFSYNDDIPAFFNAIDGTCSWNQDNTTFTFMPNMPFRGLTPYSARVNATAHGLGNNPLDGNSNGVPDGHPADDYVWWFTTAQVNDVVPPYVQSVSPFDHAQNVPFNTDIVIIFSEAMNKYSVQQAIQVSSGEVAYNFEWPNNRTVSFDLIPQLVYSNSYTITIKKTATDLVGNEMTNPYTWTFTVELWRGDVYGIVVDDATGEPISNATVTLNGVPTLTDENGHFIFGNVEQGTYRFNVTKEGYDPYTDTPSVGKDYEDIGTIRLKRTQSNQQGETPWVLLIGLLIVVMAVLIVIALLSRRRRKVQPTEFEQWKGEVAEAERPGSEQ